MSTTTPPVGLNRFATHGHHRLSYECVPSAPPSVPVVLLHALLVGRAEFGGVRAALERSHPLILPDARGHGASAGLADQRYSIAEMAAELGAVLDAAQAEAIHIVGHELGAVTAIAYAQTAPARVSSLTLIDPELPSILELAALDSTTVAAVQEARAGDEAAAETAYKGLGDRAVDQYLQPRWGTDWRDQTPKPRLATIRRNAGSLAGTLAALNVAAVDPDSLTHLGIPTLLIHGTTGRPLIRLTTDRLADLIPNARLVTLPTEAADLDLFDPATAAAVSDSLRSFLPVPNSR